ncbi:AP-1-like transcription factor [Chaetomidium leptoderma]|uniref:AP-1-like transcription factor n=1 Tax=Chaetomidium leptoderma TaxID=669021 RepID=A0AAN7A1C3_9PEZI|nr:AP-1-like transcription factor [Chaetomidium leptoderma]
MASSSFSVNTAGNPIDAADQPRSTHSGFSYSPPPPGSGQKRSYTGSLSDGGCGGGGVHAVADREPRQPESRGTEYGGTEYGGTGYGSPSATTIHTQQVNGEDTVGGGPPSVGTPSSADGGAAFFKKRKTGRGSRGVANLTPEQLERKRANDREAQRAIRERQRCRTEQYEREIADLKSTQPYQELQRALREKEAVEAELAEVKRCLTSITAMIQPIIGASAGGLRDDAVPVDQPQPYRSPGQRHGPPATHPLTAPTSHHPGSTPTSATSPASVGTAHSQQQWQNSLSPVAPPANPDRHRPPASPEMSLLHQQRYGPIYGLELGPDRLGLDFLVDPNVKIAKIQTGVNGARDTPQYHHVPMKHDWTAAISMITGTQGGPAQTQSVTSSGRLPISTAATAATPTTTAPTGPLPIYARVPRNCPPTCPLDSLLLDFLSERRQRAAEGVSQTEILGPRYPSVSSLLNPATSVYSHPLSKVFTDILARFPDLATLPERVAVLYVMFLHMRWQVAPTRENYERLPSWFRPVRQQTDREHPAWYDHLPFPQMRERLAAAYREPGAFPFDNFFIPFTSTLSVNWPYDDAYVLLASPAGDELMINPVFEQHVGVLANWTLGDAFERAFPALGGCFNLKRGD